MTQSSARFCGNCGAELPPGVNFCTSCGTRVVGAADTDPTAPEYAQPSAGAPAPEYLEPEYLEQERGGGPGPGLPRRTVLLVVGAIVLVLVAASAGAWWLFGRGADDSYAVALPNAVTEEPELAWSWEAEAEVETVVGSGDDSIALTSSDDVVALDDEGEDGWTTNVSGATYAFVPPAREDQVLVPATDDETVTALSAEDGDELWDVDGNIQQVTDDYLILVNDGELAAVDLEDGDEEWSVSVEDATFGTSADAAYVVEDGELRRLSVDEGEEEWAVGIDVEDAGYIAGAHDFVVVEGESEIAAYDAGDGQELWTIDAGEDGSTLGLMSAEQVFMAPNNFGEEGDEEVTVLVYDRDGKVGSIRADSFFYAFPVLSGRDVYAVDYGSGTVYDEDLDLLGREHEGRIELAEGGLYELLEGELSFFGFEDEKPVWTLSEDFSREARVSSGDDRVHVIDGNELFTYS